MKKFLVLLFISAIFVAVFIIIAFFVVDINAHKSYEYMILKNDIGIGKARVDMYSTEGRIIYKGRTEYKDPYLYPTVNEKYTLRKSNFDPIKYVQETEGIRRQKRLLVMEKNGEYLNYLYLNNPDFIAKKDIKIKDSAMFFSPDSLVTYFSLIEVYSFWKKGTQFMDLLIPFEDAIVPIEDTIKIEYGPFEYVQIDGRKMEADSLIISTDGIRNIVLYTSKHSHKLLMVEDKDTEEKIVLVNVEDAFEDKIKPVFENGLKMFNRLVFPGNMLNKEGILQDKEKDDRENYEEKRPLNQEKAEEIFFESENNIFSGRIWRSKEAGKRPVVLFIPKDGPMSGIQNKLINGLGEMFSEIGVNFFTFDVPGQGKSQGSLTTKRDKKRIKDIVAAASFIKKEKNIDPELFHIAGYKGGGFLALSAALEIKEVASCILLDPPLLGLNQKLGIEAVTEKKFRTTISGKSIGPFDKENLKKSSEEHKAYLDYIINGHDEFLFFAGMRLSVKAYRDYLTRNIITLVEGEENICPLFIIWSSEESDYVALETMAVAKKIIGSDKRSKVAVLGKPMENFGFVKYSEKGLNFKVDDEIAGMLKEWVMRTSTKKNILEKNNSVGVQSENYEENKEVVVIN